jgi:NAD(P)-dependent dehydrogenase (short-subunit alcohol dehydrogenase family)
VQFHDVGSLTDKLLAPGIGLAFATHLAAKGGWNITIFDLNPEAGEAAASSLQGTTFIQCDVNSSSSLAAAFHQTFTSHGNQLDFVFANAGITEKDSFYAIYPTQGSSDASPPPPPNMLPIGIDLKSVVSTTWLAQHYFRLN